MSTYEGTVNPKEVAENQLLWADMICIPWGHLDKDKVVVDLPKAYNHI